MEYWRQCALWLINCKVLPANHRVTWDSAQVFDLAQTLRDGVLLCHLLNNLRPQTINLKEINLRPQMSQVRSGPQAPPIVRSFLSSPKLGPGRESQTPLELSVFKVLPLFGKNWTPATTPPDLNSTAEPSFVIRHNVVHK